MAEPETDPMPSAADEPSIERVTNETAPSSQQGHVKLIIIGVVLIAILGAVWWCVSYTRSPQYALDQMARAARNGDWTGVSRYLDVESVTADAVDAAIAATFAGAQSRAVTSVIRPAYERVARPSLSEGFEAALLAGIAEEPMAESPTIFMAPRLASDPVSVEVDGESAVVVLGSEAAADTSLTLAMTRSADGIWRVTGWTNAAEVLETAGGSWWDEYAGSPHYSVARMTISAARGDWDEFQRYVDIDAITGALADAALAQVEQRLGGSGNPLAELGVNIARRDRAAIVQQLKDAFREAVVGRQQLSGAGSRIAAFLSGVPVRISVDGDTATVTYERTAQNGESQDVTLRLEKQDGTWRVVAFENLLGLLGS